MMIIKAYVQMFLVTELDRSMITTDVFNYNRMSKLYIDTVSVNTLERTNCLQKKYFVRFMYLLHLLFLQNFSAKFLEFEVVYCVTARHIRYYRCYVFCNVIYLRKHWGFHQHFDQSLCSIF